MESSRGVHRERAFVRLRLGRLHEAIRDADEAIRQNQGDVAAYSIRAAARAQDGDLDGALSDYEEAIWRKPTDPDLYYNRGVIFLSKNDYAGAIDDFEKVTHVVKNNADAFRCLAEALIGKMGRSFDPTRGPVIIKMAPETMEGASDPRRKPLAERSPDDNSRYKQAVLASDHVETAIQLDARNPENFYYRCNTLRTRGPGGGGIEAAISDLTDAIRLNGNEGKYYFVRGAAYLKLFTNRDVFPPKLRENHDPRRNPEDASNDLQKALDLAPNADYAPLCSSYLGVVNDRLARSRSRHSRYLDSRFGGIKRDR